MLPVSFSPEDLTMVITYHNTNIKSVTIAIYHWLTSMNKFFITVIFPHIPITSKLTDVI
ncbi:hypothetical protein AT1219_80148 [Vibrio alginolyticus]